MILPRVLLCGGFGVLISILYAFRAPVSWPILSSLVPSIVLGLLLVFRTNTAYDRFWEGRRLWGTLTINITNLARQIWVSVEERDPQDRQKIENPFGYDRNDLPLDAICASIKGNIEDLMSLPPSVRAVSNEGVTPVIEEQTIKSKNLYLMRNFYF